MRTAPPPGAFVLVLLAGAASVGAEAVCSVGVYFGSGCEVPPGSPPCEPEPEHLDLSHCDTYLVGSGANLSVLSMTPPSTSIVLAESAQLRVKSGLNCSCSIFLGERSVLEAGGEIAIRVPSSGAAGARGTNETELAQVSLDVGATLRADRLSIQVSSAAAPAASIFLGESSQLRVKGGLDCSSSIFQGERSVLEAGGEIIVNALSPGAADLQGAQGEEPAEVSLDEGASLRGARVTLRAGLLVVKPDASIEAERDLQVRAQHVRLQGSARARRGSFHASGSLTVGAGAMVAAHDVLAESCGTATVDGVVQGDSVRLMSSSLEGSGSFAAEPVVMDTALNDEFCSSLGPGWTASGREAGVETATRRSLRCTNADNQNHCLSLWWEVDGLVGAPTGDGNIYQSFNCGTSGYYQDYCYDVGGVCYLWASPCSGACGKLADFSTFSSFCPGGIRYATEAEWATALPVLNANMAAFHSKCAAEHLDQVYDFCDQGDEFVRIPDGSDHELVLVCETKPIGTYRLPHAFTVSVHAARIGPASPSVGKGWRGALALPLRDGRLTHLHESLSESSPGQLPAEAGACPAAPAAGGRASEQAGYGPGPARALQGICGPLVSELSAALAEEKSAASRQMVGAGECEANLSEAMGRLDRLAAEGDKCAAHVGELKGKVEAAGSQIDRLAAEGEECAAHLGELKGKVEAAGSRIDRLAAEVGEGAAHLGECAAALEEARGKTDGLAADGVEGSQAVDANPSSSSRLAGLLAELVKSRAEAEMLRQEKEAAEKAQCHVEAAGREEERVEPRKTWSWPAAPSPGGFGPAAALPAERLPWESWVLACLAVLVGLAVWRKVAAQDQVIEGLKAQQVAELARLHNRFFSGVGMASAASTDGASTLGGFQLLYSRDDEDPPSSSGAPRCYLPNTVFHSADGTLLLVQNLKKGMHVRLRDRREARVDKIEVFPYKKRELYDLRVLQTDQGTFEVSASHRIALPAGGERRADQLEEGDRVIVGDRAQPLVSVVQKKARTQLYSVTFVPDGQVEMFHLPSHGIATLGEPGGEWHVDRDLLRAAGLPEATEAELVGAQPEGYED